MTPPAPRGRWVTGYGLRTLQTAALETVTLYGLIVWIYVAAVAATDLDRLNEQLVRWLPLRIDTAGVVCFVASAIAFLMLDVEGARIRGSSRSEEPG